MAPDPHDRPPLDPDLIARQAFTKVRKGYEADEVRAYLVGLASQVREASQHLDSTERRLAEVERRGTDPRDLDPDAVTQLLGEETARVLEAARKAATDIRARAEESAARAIADADSQARSAREAADAYATGVRSSADTTAAKAKADADAYAESVRAAADSETAEQRRAADEYAETVRSSADDEVAALRASTQAEVERMRSEAGSILAERTAEAETAASGILSEADTYSVRVRADADRYSEATRGAADSYRTDVQGTADAYRAEATAEGDRIKTEAAEHAARLVGDAEQRNEARRVEVEAEAEAILEDARVQGRRMVDEARSYRERVIADLTDRRRGVQAEVDDLVATRDALAVALTDIATQVGVSHRALHEAVAVDVQLGDAASDRALLESGDRPIPSLDPGTVTSSSEPADEMAGSVDVAQDGDFDDVVAAEEPGATRAEDAVDAEGARTDEAAVPEAEEIFVDEPTIAIEVVDPDAEAGDADGTEGAEAEGAEAEGAGADDIAAIFDRLRAEDGDDEASPVGPDVHDHPVETPSSDGPPAEPEEPVVVDGGPDDQAAEVDEAPITEEVGESDPDTDLLDRRDTATDAVERALARRVKRVLSDEQNETLDLLRRTKGVPSIDDLLPSDADHHERYRAAALEDLTAAERAGASFFGEAPARTADVRDVAGELATEIQAQIRTKIESAVAEGGDEQELGERIRTVYREWKTQRIAATASHFVVVAFARGVAEAAPDGTAFRWLVDDGDQACPDCDDNALEGAVVKGTAFPTGDLCPPAHPGCRCLAVVVTG